MSVIIKSLAAFTQNSTLVVLSEGVDAANVSFGSLLNVDGYYLPFECDSGQDNKISLTEPWPHASVSGVAIMITYSLEGIPAAIAKAREAASFINSNHDVVSAFTQILTSPNDTVEVVINSQGHKANVETYSGLVRKLNTAINSARSTTFSSLGDTPANYQNQGGKALVVKMTENGIDFVDFPEAIVNDGGGQATEEITAASVKLAFSKDNGQINQVQGAIDSLFTSVKSMNSTSSNVGLPINSECFINSAANVYIAPNGTVWLRYGHTSNNPSDIAAYPLATVTNGAIGVATAYVNEMGVPAYTRVK